MRSLRDTRPYANTPRIGAATPPSCPRGQGISPNRQPIGCPSVPSLLEVQGRPPPRHLGCRERSPAALQALQLQSPAPLVTAEGRGKTKVASATMKIEKNQDASASRRVWETRRFGVNENKFKTLQRQQKLAKSRHFGVNKNKTKTLRRRRNRKNPRRSGVNSSSKNKALPYQQKLKNKTLRHPPKHRPIRKIKSSPLPSPCTSHLCRNHAAHTAMHGSITHLSIARSTSPFTIASSASHSSSSPPLSVSNRWLPSLSQPSSLSLLLLLTSSSSL